MSDIHADVRARECPFELPSPLPDYDVLVVAGDVGENAIKSVRWFVARGLNVKPLIFVRGNHEGYGRAWDTDLKKTREEAAKHKNVHFLQDSHVDLLGVRFIGATLWTRYDLYGEAFRWQCYTAAANGMNDHKRIRLAAGGYCKWRTIDAAGEYEVSRQYIDGMLSQHCELPRVIVTHHSPTPKSYGSDYDSRDLLNAAYASNLEHLVDRADLWVHGHIHKACDYTIGNGRVICNPRGYAGHNEHTGFNPALVIDVPLISHRKVESAA